MVPANLSRFSRFSRSGLRRLHHYSVHPTFDLTMCKLCASVFLLIASLAVCQGFFLPIFYRKQPQTPIQSSVAPVSNVNSGWNNPSPQSSFKDFGGYSSPVTQLHPVPMSSMQSMQSIPSMQSMPAMPQYGYDPSSVAAMAAYQMQPQFHNVQLVPCLCPLTRDVIEQQSQNMIHQSANPQPTAAEGTKSVVAQSSHKTS